MTLMHKQVDDLPHALWKNSKHHVAKGIEQADSDQTTPVHSNNEIRALFKGIKQKRSKYSF